MFSMAVIPALSAARQILARRTIAQVAFPSRPIRIRLQAEAAGDRKASRARAPAGGNAELRIDVDRD